jgi:hypothetical protein
MKRTGCGEAANVDCRSWHVADMKFLRLLNRLDEPTGGAIAALVLPPDSDRITDIARGQFGARKRHMQSSILQPIRSPRRHVLAVNRESQSALALLNYW